MTMQLVGGHQTATWPEGGGFHLAGGLFFTRQPDGGVLIRWYMSTMPGAEPEISLSCTAESWASVVASMEAGGKTHAAWAAARARQRGSAPEAAS